MAEDRKQEGLSKINKLVNTLWMMHSKLIIQLELLRNMGIQNENNDLQSFMSNQEAIHEQ